MTEPMIQEKTVPYKTWIKHSLVEGLRAVFQDHVDDLLRDTKVTIEKPITENSYPAVVIKYYEREIKSAGVGHYEILTVDNEDHVFLHYLYNGDIEFRIQTLSSLDRDLISDSLVQTIAMGRLEKYTQKFFQRIYPSSDEFPKAEYNYVNVNTDRIQGFGEGEMQAPWLPEDGFVYESGYRSQISGEFYSLPPKEKTLHPIEQVNVYPYIKGVEEVPEGTDDPSPWLPDPSMPGIWPFNT